MSIEIMNAVWRESKSDGRARLVLLAIADHQGEIGAWPSISTLAKMVNASERSVQRDIQYLQGIGELKVETQSAPVGGQYKSNLYWVMLPGVTDRASGVTKNASGVTDLASGVTAGGVLTLNRNLNKNINAQEQELFNEFWNAYPKKVDKAKAFKAFRSALHRANFEDILAGVVAYRNDPKRNPDFTKYPASWLNADSWENAAAAPETAVWREKALEHSKEFLALQEAISAQSVPPPRCQHDKTIALCQICLKG
jgi:hypothetical protein